MVRATLDAPPPASADNPRPPYVAGQSLPYVPPIVVRADVSARAPLGRVFGRALEGRARYGLTFLSSRPLPYQLSSPPVFFLDALMAFRYAPFELGLEAFNVLDARYASTEYAYTSNREPNGLPTLVPARHITAGAPRTILASLTLEFDP